MKNYMVIKDLFRPEPSELKIRNSMQSLAPPSDRLLASFFDFLFHIPFFSLACFIILYRLNLLKLTVATTTELMAVVAQLAWVTLIGSIILNSIYLKFWRKSPGMRIMKLEVKSNEGGSLSWEQCMLRSGVWAFEILMLGIPLIVILSHKKRQSFHDRIAETEVITLKNFGSLPPLPAERALISFISFAVIMLGLGWITAFFSLTQKGIYSGTLALSDWRENNQLCSQVDDVSSYSNVDISNIKTRLDFSIGLYLFEQIDQNCLNREIEFAFFKQIQGPLKWVGKTLLSPLNSTERIAYLNMACKADSIWCVKSLLQEKSSLNEVLSLLNSDKEEKRSDLNRSDLESPISYLAAKLILFNKIGANEHSKYILQKLQEKGLRATGLVSEHLKIISREKPEELSTALNTLKSVMVENDYLKLNAETCLRQLEVGCSHKVNECETMKSLIPKYKSESLNDHTISRAIFKDSICNKKLNDNIEYWTLINNKSLQKLIQISYEAENDSTELQALAKLRNFIKNESENMDLRFDALQVLMEHSVYSKDWLLVSEFWNQLNWSQDNYLSISTWVMREAKKQKQDSLIFAMEHVASKLPGLKLDWSLLKTETSHSRLPASTKEK